MKTNDVPDLVSTAVGPLALWDQAWRYQLDLFQRSVLFLDILRERANNMLAHEAAGLPPLIHFEYEQILDARHFARPANYALLKITACGGTSTAKVRSASVGT